MQQSDLALPAVPPSAERISSLSVAALVNIPAEVDWIVPDLLPARSLVLVAGDAKKARKSLMMQYMALCIAGGLPFLGRQPQRARPVIYSSLEDDVRDTAIRFRHFGVKPDSTLPLVLTFDIESFAATPTQVIKRLEAAKQAEFEGAAKRERTGVWIVDTLAEAARLHGVKDESSSMEVTGILRAYREFAYHTGWAVIFVHHFRKSGDTMRGSVALNAASSGWWEVRHQKGQNVRQIDWTLRNGREGSTGVEFVNEPGVPWRFENREAPGIEPQDAQQRGASRRGPAPEQGEAALATHILDVIVANPMRGWSLETIREAVAPASKKRVGDLVRAMCARGELGHGANGYCAVAGMVYGASGVVHANPVAAGHRNGVANGAANGAVDALTMTATEPAAKA